MADTNHHQSSGDPYDLSRFLIAQSKEYEQALAELSRGKKDSHWMWYIFPQVDGLGSSETAREFAIKSLAEADAYLRHPVLGARLPACVAALLELKGRTALHRGLTFPPAAGPLLRR